MPRKTTRKPKRGVRKKTSSKSKDTPVKSTVAPIRQVSKPVSTVAKKTTKDSEYLGYHYETWINIMLVVAVILIIGILAGVGVLVQKAQAPVASVPKFTTMTTNQGIGIAAAKAKAKKVLDIIAGGTNYNITKVYEDHGVYRFDLAIKTPTGVQNGSAFMSLDGKQMYFRYLDVDSFLQKYSSTNTTA